MDLQRPNSAARRSTLSIPPKPDASLAEWTSKIKELQKQVDEDEEAETRRLEAEIAASRQARLRRSTGYSRANSIDLSPSTSPIKAEDRSRTSESVVSAIDRQKNQEDALRKLTGETPPARPPIQSAPNPISQVKKHSEPISLAAFMGGRATGPKLTRQAPQPDAHDPTQFEQRTHITAPHPVFGRGGVAMPGMTGSGSASVVSRAIGEQENQPIPSGGQPQRDRPISTSSAVRSAVQKAEERHVLPSYTGMSSQSSARQRTISTPTGMAPSRASSVADTSTLKPKPDPVTRPLSHSPNPSPRPITPHNGHASPAPYSTSKSPTPRPTSAASQLAHTPPPPSPTRSPRPTSTTPGLARPIQPVPRPSFGSPQMPPSQNPSPAFLKPPPAKEPTPSLSRLQGRGFVQSIVKKTVEKAATVPDSPTPERQDSAGKRQSSVLDRWQFNSPTGSPSLPPVMSPKPVPMRKSFTTDPSSPNTSTYTTYSAPLKGENTGRVLKSKSSLPSLPTRRTGDSLAGPSSMSESGYSGPRPMLGSSKTVITYIQPSKTGDQPAHRPAETHGTGPDVDELGMRTRTRTTSGGLVQERGAAGLPATSGKPLSHPTKDRAKKPRKGKTATSASVSKLAAIREVPPITPPQSSSQKPPVSPAKHIRIPSTGNRATVMDVAQVFQEVLQSTSPTSTSPIERKPPSPPPAVDAARPSEVAAKDEQEENPPAMERRRSSYDKYSAFVLPPLAEEKTPVPSPAGTLARGAAAPVMVADGAEDLSASRKMDVQDKTKTDQAVVTAEAVEAKSEPRHVLIHLAHNDEPLPNVNVDALYRMRSQSYTPDPDLTTVSVDVLAIVGNTASPISKDANVFYDGELLAVVHRAKARSSGLVQTKVWGWQGRRSHIGDRETQKLQELARRYGTSAVLVQQGREPLEFIFVLGGQLATRQGTRTHWSPENTAMHVVRSLYNLIFVDELDLGIRNLCSGHSYCISILDTYYVWHGRGSTIAEQQAALKYTQELASSPEHIVQLTEDESQADEMFWMILGEGDYAKADYWRWRPHATAVYPRLWIVDTKQEDDVVRSIPFFPAKDEFNNFIYLVDCVWELFVLVGSEARGQRSNIRLALSVAEALAQRASSERPFKPTVHVLVFPTQIPADLRLTFRELEEESELNGGKTPDHMNLIPASNAVIDLQSSSWTLAALEDRTMLPLGVTPASLN
ncbi:hypothetical protein BN946_scf184645.g3 [Trametes cinnabarina]|uniref:Gelsolin-like domain-containing protein n=1 Tax=Pycnoporus cinnabarinus TaxID=5643 RepID=A0A060SIP0_PYCCI|nr:hypothetical protein BN946_scf184645.g3 [Trametes cinnabarina]